MRNVRSGCDFTLHFVISKEFCSSPDPDPPHLLDGGGRAVRGPHQSVEGHANPGKHGILLFGKRKLQSKT